MGDTVQREEAAMHVLLVVARTAAELFLFDDPTTFGPSCFRALLMCMTGHLCAIDVWIVWELG